MFDRTIYFDLVRKSLFSGVLTTQQVQGQEAILADWEGTYPDQDIRWLAYALATTIHETASTMWPIEEYGKGSGMEYGEKDPETGQTYYGRGYVQLTWRDNYHNAAAKLELTGTEDDLEWHAEKALDPFIAGHVMFRGMIEGWFRSDSQGRQTLSRYFNTSVDDAYGAREIINGDKSKIPSWSTSSIGNIIKGYHQKFLTALQESWMEFTPVPEPAPPVAWPPTAPVIVSIQAPPGVDVTVFVNGEAMV